MNNPHEDGMQAARRVSHYYIGDASWAELIVNAYVNPGEALKQLSEEKED